VDHKAFLEKLLSSPHPVVVDFWAPWCLPCRAIEPALKRLEVEYSGQVVVLRLNADEQGELLSALKIFGIPTLIAYQGGQEVLRQNGAQGSASLIRLFEAAQQGAAPAAAGLPRSERVVRATVGVSLMILAWIYGPNLILGAFGGLIAFSAVYDRCPLWRALAPRLRALLRRRTMPGSR